MLGGGIEEAGKEFLGINKTKKEFKDITLLLALKNQKSLWQDLLYGQRSSD